MSNETQHTPADVRERVAKEVYLWEATRFGADESWALRRWREESNTRRELYFNVADRILALLRTPRGEGEAREEPDYITCMGCGQEFDPDDDTQSRYHEAACEVVDYEPARVEIARRLRGAALRSEAQGEEEPVAWLVERRGVEMFGWHPVHVYLGKQNAENIARVLRDGEWDVRVVPLYRATRRPEAQGEDRWEDLIFSTLIEAYNEAHAARQGEGGGQ